MGLYYLKHDSEELFVYGVDGAGDIVYTLNKLEAALMTMRQAQRLLSDHTPFSVNEEEAAEIARHRVDARPLEELARAEDKVGKLPWWRRIINWLMRSRDVTDQEH